MRTDFLPLCVTWSAALVLAVSACPAAETGFQSRSVTKEHADELRRSVMEAAQKVNQAATLAERAKWQEELCKRLIQSEDYDNALRVAWAVHQTDGIEPERRAAHHFLVARIYRMMMDASPSADEMETARFRALKTLEEVRNARYPAGWGVSAAAAQLERELQDPKTLATARFAAGKRASGGIDTRQAQAAKAQTAAMEQAIFGRSGSSYSAGAMEAAPVSASPLRQALQSRMPADSMTPASSGGGLAPLQSSGGGSAPLQHSGAGASEDFPAFGTAAGRPMAPPTLSGGRSSAGSMTAPSTPQTFTAMAPRSTMTQPAPSQGYSALPPLGAEHLYGQGNRTSSVNSQTGVVTGGRAGRSTPATASTSGVLPSGTRMQARTTAGAVVPSSGRVASGSGDDMIRFSWADAKNAGASSQGTSRLSGPIVIDGRNVRQAKP